MVGLNKIHLHKSQEKLSQKILEDEHCQNDLGTPYLLSWTKFSFPGF